MTPIALLERVKAQFVTLLHDEDVKLESLLIQALTEYQDRAGAWLSIAITHEQNNDGGIDIPSNFLGVMNSHDSDHTWLEVTTASGKLNVVTNGFSAPPYTVNYIVELSQFDLHKDELPKESIGLIQKYLKVLIEIPNTEREMYARSASGMPLDGLPSISDLEDRKRRIEDEMESGASMLMPSMII